MQRIIGVVKRTVTDYYASPRRLVVVLIRNRHRGSACVQAVGVGDIIPRSRQGGNSVREIVTPSKTLRNQTDGYVGGRGSSRCRRPTESSLKQPLIAGLGILLHVFQRARGSSEHVFGLGIL